MHYEDGNQQWKFLINGAVESTLGTTGWIVPNVYATTTTTAVNMNVHTDGRVRRSTSSSAYKQEIEPWTGKESVLDLIPKLFYGMTGNLTKGEALVREGKTKQLGLIMEDVAEHFPKGVQEPDGIDWNAMYVGLLKEVQVNRKRIRALEARV